MATSWQAIRALRAEAVAEARARDAEVEKAKAEAVTSFLTQMLGSVDPSQARGRDVSVREALDNVERKPPVRFPWFKAEIQSTLGRVLAAERKSAEAEKLLLAGYEGLRDLPSTPLPRLRIALERLVSFHAASDRSAEAESWRNRLQAFESSRPAPKPTTTSNQD